MHMMSRHGSAALFEFRLADRSYRRVRLRLEVGREPKTGACDRGTGLSKVLVEVRASCHRVLR